MNNIRPWQQTYNNGGQISIIVNGLGNASILDMFRDHNSQCEKAEFEIKTYKSKFYSIDHKFELIKKIISDDGRTPTEKLNVIKDIIESDLF